MRKAIFFSLLVVVFVFISCQPGQNTSYSEKYKAELFAVEKAFCAMAQTDGVQQAFVHFAADSAVVLRKEKVIKGKAAIRQLYESFPKKGVKLEWAPDFAEVSSSGDLGYTYGKYTYTSTDTLGVATQSEGVFHTVWKRQPDGSWKFVWD